MLGIAGIALVVLAGLGALGLALAKDFRDTRQGRDAWVVLLAVAVTGGIFLWNHHQGGQEQPAPDGAEVAPQGSG